METYREFARFPIQSRSAFQGKGMILEWVDLRFMTPGRGFPFRLRLHLDAQGRLKSWRLGHS